MISAAITSMSVPPVFTHVYRTLHPEPIEVAKAFYKATYARDVGSADAHLSAADRRAKDHTGYVYGRESFSGFALELAKRFADLIEFQVVEREISAERARLTLDYRVPAADEHSLLLFNWNQSKLNALPRAKQQSIVNALENLAKGGNAINIEGRETFNLVKENGRWKVFLDWASGINVTFAATLPVHNALEVEFLQPEIFARKDEPFQSNLKLRNRGQHPVVTRIDHRIEPKEYAGDITMIACGFLRPLTLGPGEEREVSSAYLLDPGFPKSKALNITYVFKVESSPRAER